MSEPTEKKGRRITKLWVAVVLLIGFLVGLPLSLLTPIPETLATRGIFAAFGPILILRLHVILSTLESALIISLLAVYVKVYRATRSNFSLGLVIVFSALLAHFILSNPVFLGLTVPRRVAFLPVGDIFMIIAYTVFLYLSLE